MGTYHPSIRAGSTPGGISMKKVPISAGLMISSLRDEAANLQKQSDLLSYEAQDLRCQAEEIAKVYEVA
jgi:hypothetical protein